jgi:hypothetical protein
VKQKPLLMLIQKKSQNRISLLSGFLTENLEVSFVLLERITSYTKQYTLRQIAEQSI